METTRRNFMKLSLAGLAASTAPALFGQGDTPQASPGKSALPFELGIASYTLREFSLDEVITMSRQLNINKLCLKSMHLPLELSADEIRTEVEKIRTAGLDLYGGGVIYMKTEEEVDHAFKYAKNAGMKVIVGVPAHDLLERCDALVKKTGIKLAIHNHGPGDDLYPTPESAYKLIRNLDPGMGLCIDIGHTVRIGSDPIEETKAFFDRVHDIHIKDEDEASPEGKTCEIGRGVIDIPGYLELLLKMNYSNVLGFEYEKDGKNPMPGLAESIGYVRGALRILNA